MKLLPTPKRPATKDQVRRLWDKKALEWNAGIGKDGDQNRRLNSDPVLWKMLGPVRNKSVLDAGCGTGYLSLKMAAKGARVLGVDHSPAMIKVAEQRAQDASSRARFLVSSLDSLLGQKSKTFDLAVSNYVLMDLRNLEGAVAEIRRVLKPGGHWICIVLHPCFDHGMKRLKGGGVRYTWTQRYIERHEYWESWGQFSSPFVTFHRSLSDYWRVFRKANFEILDFQEPMVSPGNPLSDKENIQKLRWTPFSVAFKLKKH
jgi:SAM-dependent methyltransferase